MRGMRLCAAVAVLALIVGCAQAPKKQAFNREAATHIKTVVVSTRENQTEYEAAVLGHPGMSFGLIGGLVAAADMAGKTSKLTAAVDPKETRLQERFGERLKLALTKLGYETSVVVVPKAAKDEEVLPLSTKQASGDAVLAVDLFAGYWAAGPSTDYFPRLLAKVRAMDVKSGGVLYEDTITYGYAMPNMPTVHLASEPRFRFRSIDALVADPAKAREGWYTGLDAIAAQIADDLRRQ